MYKATALTLSATFYPMLLPIAFAKNVDEIDSMVEVIVSNKHSCFTKVQN